MSHPIKLLVVTAAWGDWHVAKLLELNLPTLLAEGNFPALARVCDVNYVIHTSAADLARIRDAAVVRALGDFVQLEFRTISVARLENPIQVHHEYWAEATSEARREGAFVLLMPPDVAWSDGSFAHVARLLQAGKRAIFMSYLRVESESFFAALSGRSRAGTAAISVPGADLVDIALRTLHPLMAAYLRDSDHFPIHPEMMLWAVGNEGVLCRLLSREMFIFEPARVELTSQNLLETAFDLDQMHVVRDSDDLFAVSLAPFEKEIEWYRWPRQADPDTISDWWLNYDSWMNDFLVGTKLRWHSRPVTESLWRARERGADLFLRRAAVLREGRYLWRTARTAACTSAARFIATAVATGLLTRAARGRGGSVVFLPVNAAFWHLPQDRQEQLLSPGGAGELMQLLRRHYVPGETTGRPRALEDALGTNDAIELRTADGTPVRVTRRLGALEVDDVRIVGGPIKSGKQYVYLVERLLDANAPASDREIAPRISEPSSLTPPRSQKRLPGVVARPRSMELVLPEQYDAHEERGTADLPIPMLMGFMPITFERYSYPTRIREMRALQRYADHNCEAEVPGLFVPGAVFAPVGYVNAFTADERDLLGIVRERVARALGNDFGRPIKPITNLLVQIGPFRALTHLARTLRREPLSMFEVGPGAAYIGALMAIAGHRYAAFDITQSLYIWQQYMLRAVAGPDFVETAGFNRFEEAPAARITHLPWWQYVRFLESCPIRTDFVYSNSNLGEMSPLALKLVLEVSKRMLEHSPLGVFAYFSTGMTAQSSVEQIAAAFAAAGYEQAIAAPLIVYVLKGRDPTPIQAAFREGIPFFNPSGRGGRFDANTVMALKRAEAPLDAAIAAWQYGWQPPYSD